MLVYHQCGHNYIWNIQALLEDDSGDGLIVSPVNIQAQKIAEKIPVELRAQSWFDPQFYLPHDNAKKLATYSFFPANVLGSFNTTDFEAHALEVARECLRFQHDLGFKYLLIPTRYYDDLPEDHLEQLTHLFVEPFLEARQSLGLNEPALLSIIAKPLHLEFGSARDQLLTWATSFDGIAGIYLLFDHNFYSKQIKDPAYLAGALRLIRALRHNDLEVHVGYSGLEGLLLSVADPTSATVGSYENLRSFSTLRMETREASQQRGPRPRIYSGRLLQSIEDTSLPPLRQLVPGWAELFDESPYSGFLLNPNSALSFQRSEVYKHYFYIFSRQVNALPPLNERADHIRERVTHSLALFEEIRTRGVVLGPDADGSHLIAWLNALAMYEHQPA